MDNKVETLVAALVELSAKAGPMDGRDMELLRRTVKKLTAQERHIAQLLTELDEKNERLALLEERLAIMEVDA